MSVGENTLLSSMHQSKPKCADFSIFKCEKKIVLIGLEKLISSI